MKATDLLSSRRRELERVVTDSFKDARAHSEAFARRVLNAEDVRPDGTGLDLSTALDRMVYGGYPEVAFVGFAIGGRKVAELPSNLAESYHTALERLCKRTGSRLAEFASDDIAVLGVAEGTSALASQQALSNNSLIARLLEVIERHRTIGVWSGRARDLAADLLDGRGRLRTATNVGQPDQAALDLCLRNTWSQAFRSVAPADNQARAAILDSLLKDPTPKVGDLERAAAWLVALDLLVKQAAQSLVTSPRDIVNLLRNTQSALKRWVWEEDARRRGTQPAKWVIDNEYHVQSLLWTILYPIFGSDLRDEQYVPGYGLAQPRYDLAIISLKLIIEVKFVRRKSDFKEIEEQVAGDLGLYFEDANRFEQLIAYVYDDCETPYPEQHDILRNALMGRDPRVVDVVVTSRPGRLPSRSQRSA